MTRLPVTKTYKLFIGGEFQRSESGRSYAVDGHNVARGSRKDIRDAVLAARAGYERWSGLTAYNRGQVIYRLAEMLESRYAALSAACTGSDEVDRCLDSVVWHAGWPDKLAQVLGSANPVAGPYFNFTIPEPMGVVGILAPPGPPLEAVVARLLPVLAAGNAAVVVAPEAAPIAALELAEALATCDLPSGAANIVSGFVDELGLPLASHMAINAIDLPSNLGSTSELARQAATSVTRVITDPAALAPRLQAVAAFVEYKTVWHPAGF